MNQKLSLNPALDSADDVTVPSDDAVRQALLRMGSGRPAGGNQNQPRKNNAQKPHQKPQPQGFSGGNGQKSQTQGQFGYGGGGSQRRGGDQLQAAQASPDARRRRFSQNEHVPVEYVSRERQAGRGEPLRLDLGRLDPARVDAAEPAEDRTGFLQRELDRERQARVAVERTLEETRAALTAARTRIAHLEIDLQEARAQRQAMIDMAQSAAQQSAAQQAAASQQAADVRAAAAAAALSAMDEEGDEFTGEATPAKRGRGRPRRVPVATEAEPEPVKWWSDD